MAALICQACILPCQACAECVQESCKCMGDVCQPVADALCNPEHPFSSCVCMTMAVTLLPAVATVAISASAFGSLNGACARSQLPVYAIVHVPILMAHALFAYYMNKQFVEVDRGRAVVGKFWQMFMYDPVVLLYILFLVFNIIWLAFTQSALSSARYERCCDASPALCSVTLAVFVIEILFFILAPCVLAFSLLSECCNAAEGERKEEARRRQEAKHAQRSASQPMGMRVLSSLPIVGCIFAPQQRSTPPPARGAGYGAHSTGAAHGGSRLPHAEAVPVRRPAPEVMARPASSQPPAAQHGPPYAQAAYSPPAAAYSASAQPAYVQPACAYAEPAHVRAEPASGSCTSSAYCSAEASTAPPHYYGVQPSAVASAPPPPQYSAAPARPQQQPAEEESTSVLLGKLAGKAVKGVAAGAAAGVNAVNAARNKGAHGTHSATQGQGVHGAGGHTSEGAATARQL